MNELKLLVFTIILLTISFLSLTAQDMNHKNFSTTLTVDQSPAEVFSAVMNVREWWSDAIEGSTLNLNDEFTYQYEDLHRCKMKLIEVIPGKKVVWLVEENYFSFTNDKTEWTGTRIIFDIERSGNKTQLTFTHDGLVPDYECYAICSNAWTSYINGSLLSLIITGQGHVNQKKEINAKALNSQN